MRVILIILSVYVAVILLSLVAQHANAQVYVGVSQSFVNSSSRVGEVGYRFPNNWDLNVMLIGADYQYNHLRPNSHRISEVYVGSISKVLPSGLDIYGAGIFGRLGVSYVHDSMLVGEFNYRVGVGLEWNSFEVEYGHYSSADIYETNTGIDLLMGRYKF